MWKNLTIEKAGSSKKIFNVGINERTYALYIILTSLAACTALYIVEQYIGVDYITKTCVKIALFLLIPLFYAVVLKRNGITWDLKLRPQGKSSIIIGLISGLAFSGIVIGAYYLLMSFIDLNVISSDLEQKLKIFPGNFIYVALYITLVNSFLEEFFFRGFIFLNLSQGSSKVFAHIYSALLFALYHIMIFINWFSIYIFLLALAGLTVVGLLFNLMNSKSKTFINSWIAHILANSAIMIIGMWMFGIIKF